jgi:UPF0271 protein
MPIVNINADIGESFGAWKMGNDAGVMPLINSANIACGFHASDPLVMRKTVELAMARGVKGVDASLIYVCLAHSQIEKTARALGMRIAVEGFIDRMYDEDANLTDRRNKDALHHDPAVAAAQAVAMAVEGVIVTREGKRIPTEIHSMCLHGDEPTAQAVGGAARQALIAAGVVLKGLPDMAL